MPSASNLPSRPTSIGASDIFEVLNGTQWEPHAVPFVYNVCPFCFVLIGVILLWYREA